MIKKLFNIKGIIEYLGTFPKVISENSTKLLALLISALAGGFLLSIIIPFILLWDVISNGHIVTDLSDMGLFVLCIAGVIYGAGVNIKVPEMPRIDNRPERHHDDDPPGGGRRQPTPSGPSSRRRTRSALQDEDVFSGEEDFDSEGE